MHPTLIFRRLLSWCFCCRSLFSHPPSVRPKDWFPPTAIETPMSSQSDQSSTPKNGQPAPDLALIRTDLANERTLLAYGRSALMLVATGVSLVEFLDVSFSFVLMGWGLIAAGAIVGSIGSYRFTSLKQRLNAVREG